MSAPKTLSERDGYLQTRENEHQTNLKVLRAFPPDQIHFRPHEKSKTAIELAWMFVLQHGLTDGLLADGVAMTTPPPVPATWAELIAAYEKAHAESMTKFRAMSEEAMDGAIQMPVGPGKMGEIRRGTALWFFLYDMIHHRGQFSVYLRMVGAKVPAIYGPSADEPWK